MDGFFFSGGKAKVADKLVEKGEGRKAMQCPSRQILVLS